MIGSITSSVSAIKAAVKTYEVSARNTANVNTDGFKKDSAHISEGEYGVVVSIEKGGSVEKKQGDSDAEVVLPSDVNPAEEAVDQMSAKHMISYNAAVIKTEDEMTGSLLDVFA